MAPVVAEGVENGYVPRPPGGTLTDSGKLSAGAGRIS